MVKDGEITSVNNTYTRVGQMPGIIQAGQLCYLLHVIVCGIMTLSTHVAKGAGAVGFKANQICHTYYLTQRHASKLWLVGLALNLVARLYEHMIRPTRRANALLAGREGWAGGFSKPRTCKRRHAMSHLPMP